MGARAPLGGVLLAMLLLTACAQQPQLPVAADWVEHSARLAGLTIWTVEGKIALQTPDQVESASIQWRQHEAITRLYLSGPLGIAATRVYSDGKTLEIRQGEELRSWDLTDAGALEGSTGWDLPLAALAYWLKGLPAPELDIQRMELGQGQSQLQVLRQDDWEIHYLAYANYGGITLPTKLQIQRRDTTVKLVIRDWQIAPA